MTMLIGGPFHGKQVAIEGHQIVCEVLASIPVKTVRGFPDEAVTTTRFVYTKGESGKYAYCDKGVSP